MRVQAVQTAGTEIVADWLLRRHRYCLNVSQAVFRCPVKSLYTCSSSLDGRRCHRCQIETRYAWQDKWSRWSQSSWLGSVSKQSWSSWLAHSGLLCSWQRVSDFCIVIARTSARNSSAWSRTQVTQQPSYVQVPSNAVAGPWAEGINEETSVWQPAIRLGWTDWRSTRLPRRCSADQRVIEGSHRRSRVDLWAARQTLLTDHRHCSESACIDWVGFLTDSRLDLWGNCRTCICSGWLASWRRQLTIQIAAQATHASRCSDKGWSLACGVG